MATDVLADLGHVFLGSRLKRLAERLQADAAKIIRDTGFDFQPSQFPLLAALDRCGPLTVGEAVVALGVSQPAVTRGMTGLIDLGLVETSRPGADRRSKTIALTARGADVVSRAKAAIWPGVGAAVADACAGLSGTLLDQIGMLEGQLTRASLDERFSAFQRAAAGPALSIVDYSDALAGAFYAINAEWIETMFAMEASDRDVLENPRARIVEPGGAILFVRAADLGIVGTCALRKEADGCFELTKMAVTEAARGRKAGEFLLAATLARARSMRIETLYLLTNTRCAAAIHLYEKLGFAHDAAIMRRFGGQYARCNVAMAWRGAAAVGRGEGRIRPH